MLLLGLAALSTGQVVAGVHACPLPGGGKIFQDRPCEPVPPVVPQRTGDASARADGRRRGRTPSTPARIDASWLQTPERAVYEAFCDRRGCECGPRERVFSDLGRAVADALFIDGAWLRYERSSATHDDAASPIDSFTARSGLDDATCDLQMSQRTLHLFIEPTLQRLRQEAGEPGRTNTELEGLCDTGQAAACESLDKRLLYHGMLLDLEALQRPRARSPDDR